MFKKVFNVLFPKKNQQTYSQAAQKAPSNSAPVSTAKTPTQPDSLRLDVPLMPHDADFLNYLFGESQPNEESDPFSLYIAVQIERALRSPKAIMSELPVMPASVTTLLNELDKDDFNVDALLAVIEREPSMATEVIKLANSARYRRSEREVTDLKTAFMNMGARGLIEGVIDTYLKNFVPSKSIYWRQFGEKIWQHSSQTAQFATDFIYDDQMGQDRSTAYFVGLICNLGKMVIFQIMIDAFRHVDPSVPPNSIVFKKLINNYAVRLTYTIAKSWELPAPILKAIVYQATPTGQGSQLGIAVFEANYLSELTSLLEARYIDAYEFELRYKQNLTSLPSRKSAAAILDTFEVNLR